MGSYLLLAFLILFSAVVSGLSAVVPSMNPFDLKRRASTGNKAARRLYNIRKHNNLLLVTLITFVVATDVLISIKIANMFPIFTAILIATSILTVFTKIIPGSLYINHIYVLGNYTAWVAALLIKLFYPICRPISLVLDHTIGVDKPNNFSRDELIKFIEEHGLDGSQEIKSDEEAIAKNALSFGAKPIKSIMTPRSRVFWLNPEQIINTAIINEVKEHGHSRIPVFDLVKNQIEGVIYTMQLLQKENINKAASEICDRKIVKLPEDMTLDGALKIFLKRRHHLGIVLNEYKEIIGIITLEDILEEILGREIVDEYDLSIHHKPANAKLP